MLTGRLLPYMSWQRWTHASPETPVHPALTASNCRTVAATERAVFRQTSQLKKCAAMEIDHKRTRVQAALVPGTRRSTASEGSDRICLADDAAHLLHRAYRRTVHPEQQQPQEYRPALGDLLLVDPDLDMATYSALHGLRRSWRVHLERQDVGLSQE